MKQHYVPAAYLARFVDLETQPDRCGGGGGIGGGSLNLAWTALVAVIAFGLIFRLVVRRAAQ